MKNRGEGAKRQQSRSWMLPPSCPTIFYRSVDLELCSTWDGRSDATDVAARFLLFRFSTTKAFQTRAPHQYLSRPANTAIRGRARRDHFLVTYPACHGPGGGENHRPIWHFRVVKVPVKKLLWMKLFARFYVFIYEARAKLYVAKKDKDHDHTFHKATASSRRPPKP